ncbi:phage minor capsid protein [Glycomyces arizonensis]|uniref:phage minor capsid protein n=1 Tax=Glycomyces arizonensis TaxID=256035 RepID=UPI00042983C0|nr:phage minor capsid protein [Glycomyces arizonensis]
MPVSRTLAEGLAANLAALYRDAETRLAQNLARRIRTDITTSSDNRLTALASLRRQSEAVLAELSGRHAVEAERALMTAYARGASAAVDEMARLSGERWVDWLARRSRVAAAITRLFGIARRREMRLAEAVAALRADLPGIDSIMVLARELTQRMSSTHLHVLRWQDDAYREVMGQPVFDVLAGTKTRLRAAQVAWEHLLSKGVAGFTDKRGRNWELASYVEMATRTAVAQAGIEGHLDRITQAGADLVIVSNAPEECKRCRPWEGQVLSISGPAGPRVEEHAIEDFNMLTIDVKATVGEAIAAGLMHPNCFPAEVAVSAPSGVRAADARWYEGPLVVIHTAGGDELPVTPNHPILTPKGWVPAGEITEGDHVLRYCADVETPALSTPDDHEVPASIGEIFNALRESSQMPPVRVPVAPEQFHGDGIGSDVDVVLADGFLRDAVNAETVEMLGEFELFEGGVRTSALLPEGTAFEIVESSGHAAHGFVGGGDLSGSLLCRHGLPLPALSLATVGAVAAPQQDAADGGLGPVDALGDLGLRDAFEVHPDGIDGPSLARGDLLLSGQPSGFEGRPGDASGFEPLADPRGADADGGRNLVRALASEVTADDVVKVDVRDFAGHVYNLQTGDGWYVAGGLVVSNCRHRISMYLPGVTKVPTHTADPEGDHARQKLRRLERELRALKRQEAAVIDPAAKTAFGKKIRAKQAQIRAHVAETGPQRQPHREQIGTAR